MLKLKNLEPRQYQKEIFQTCKEYNTLVVLPTGTGKTAISLLLAIDRLNKYPNSKMIICTPTKPLCAQHYKTFKEKIIIDPDKVVLLTGLIQPKKRQELWETSQVIVATPQTIQSDLENKRISLKDVSLLCIDEAHRSRQRFANTILAKNYSETATHPRILALTASPGNNKESINEICENLIIEKVEIRTENDISEYLQKKEIEWVNVELPKELIEIHSLFKKLYKTKAKELKKFGLTKPINIISKKDLLLLQPLLRKQIKEKNPMGFYGISLTAQMMKLDYALELIETQGLPQLNEFLAKLKSETSKAAKNILTNPQIKEAIFKTEKALENNIKHPKLEKISELVKVEFENNPSAKILIFANYRNTVQEIEKELKKVKQAKPIKLIGQKQGLTQKEQISTIEKFEDNLFNILIGTQILEEGLDLKNGADSAIFYDHASSSSIRKIQRVGRVGRIKSGKILFLITKNTRDMAYYWKAQKDEKRMKAILYRMQNNNDIQSTLY